VDINEPMNQAGCKKVFFGLESGDNSVLKVMNKNTTVDSAEKTLTHFSQCGIETAGFFLVRYPGESYETIEHTLQNRLLRLRDVIFSLFYMHSRTSQGSLKGNCSVVYEKTHDGLVVSVEGSLDPKTSQIILLNEVDGTSFNRIRIEETLLQGSQIPSWHAVQPGCRLKSSLLNIGFSIAFVPDTEASELSMYCGREVAPDLDWAGFSLEATSLPITYEIHIHGTQQ